MSTTTIDVEELCHDQAVQRPKTKQCAAAEEGLNLTQTVPRVMLDTSTAWLRTDGARTIRVNVRE